MVFHLCEFFHCSWYVLGQSICSHILSSRMVSSGWILSCLFKWPDVVKFFSHFEQLYGFSPVWILAWVFNSPDVLHLYSHLEQLNGFSPVWILSWQFNLLLEVNGIPHLEQLIGLLKVLHLSLVFPDSSQFISLLMASSSSNTLWISIGSWVVSDSMVNHWLKLTWPKVCNFNYYVVLY